MDFYTSYDMGHRHKVTIPDLLAVRRKARGHVEYLQGVGRGLGQFGSTQWYRVYESNRFAGWAYVTPSDASIFSGSCGNAIRAVPQPGFWEQLFGARNPSYDGASGWFQIWNKTTRGFLGWYMLGFRTAQRVRLVCPNLDVFTSHGQAV